MRVTISRAKAEGVVDDVIDLADAWLVVGEQVEKLRAECPELATQRIEGVSGLAPGVVGLARAYVPGEDTVVEMRIEASPAEALALLSDRAGVLLDQLEAVLERAGNELARDGGARFRARRTLRRAEAHVRDLRSVAGEIAA